MHVFRKGSLFCESQYFSDLFLVNVEIPEEIPVLKDVVGFLWISDSANYSGMPLMI